MKQILNRILATVFGTALIIGAGMLVNAPPAQASLALSTINLAPATTNGGLINSQIAPATPAVRTVKSGAGNVYSITCTNKLSTAVDVHVFDIASGSITLGTTAETYGFSCPGNTAGAGFTWTPGVPVGHANAINYSVSLNTSTTDNTAITASSVRIVVVYF